MHFCVSMHLKWIFCEKSNIKMWHLGVPSKTGGERTWILNVLWDIVWEVGATPWWSSEQLGDWLGWKKRIWDYRWVFCHERDTGDLNWWFESGETIKSDKCVCLCCILFAKQQNVASKFLKKAQQSCCRHGNKHTKIFMEFFLLLQTGPINAYSVATLQHWDLKGSISPRMSPFYF